MKDHPILFQGDMVLAIMTCAKCGTVTLELECPTCGSRERCKTQTRRVVPGEIHIDPSRTSWHWHKPRGGYMEQHDRRGNDRAFRNMLADHCPYGAPGDLLWVRETWWAVEVSEIGLQYGVFDDEIIEGVPTPKEERLLERQDWRWGRHPSIHMPKLICRLWLKVKSVRVERVQEISNADAITEGVSGVCNFCTNNDHIAMGCDCARDRFCELWDSINAKRGYGWKSNPFVWVIEFERHDK